MTHRFHDTVVNVAAHPIRWPLARLTRVFGGRGPGARGRGAD